MAAYADIEDVEARLGDALSDSEAESLEIYLDDFSTFLDVEIAKVGKTVGNEAGQVKPALLKIVVAQRGVNKHLSADKPFGVTQFSRSIGEVSESVSLSSASSGTAYGDFWLSHQERSLLGIGQSGKFQSIEMECDW